MFFSFNFIPVAKVNGEIVSYAEFLKVLGAMQTFDDVSGRTPADPDLLKAIALAARIENILLDDLVDENDASIHDEARRVVDEAILATEGLNLTEAANALYSISAEDFVELVLLPQAKKDLLANHFGDDQERFTERLVGIYKVADVRVYYPGFAWEGGGIIAK